MAKPETIDLSHILSLTWSTTTTYNASSIITYNLALGASGTDLPLCFEGHPSFHALPTFGTLPVISAMSAVTKSMPDFLPGFQPHNHVHGEHYLELKSPFPIPGPGEEIVLETTARVVEVVDRRSGVTVCVGITTFEKGSGGEICYNEWTSFVMKVPGQGALVKAAERGVMSKIYPSPDRKPDLVVEFKTTPEQGALYRAASGDLNPLHIDPGVAKKGGFEGPILTGTCTLGLGVKQVIDAFAGGDCGRFRGMKVRLSKPVFPGDMVRTEMWREDGGRLVRYRQCVGERVVMRDAAVMLDVDGGTARL
jgi:acyl dehydratase